MKFYLYLPVYLTVALSVSGCSSGIVYESLKASSLENCDRFFDMTDRKRCREGIDRKRDEYEAERAKITRN
jgi:hypothetical protein